MDNLPEVILQLILDNLHIINDKLTFLATCHHIADADLTIDQITTRHDRTQQRLGDDVIRQGKYRLLRRLNTVHSAISDVTHLVNLEELSVTSEYCITSENGIRGLHRLQRINIFYRLNRDLRVLSIVNQPIDVQSECGLYDLYSRSTRRRGGSVLCSA